MGSSQSTDSNSNCPWRHSSGVLFNSLFEQKIIDLSSKSSNFIQPHSTLDIERVNDFNIEKYTDVINHAMKFDSRLTQIFAQLVPRKYALYY